MLTFNQALHMSLNEMQPKNAEDIFCCAIYNDDLCSENALVMFMEYANYSCMHDVMYTLYNKLSEKMGYPVSICHNNPTDEIVLIYGSILDSSHYDPFDCCRINTIENYTHYKLQAFELYRPEIRSIYKAAVHFAKRKNMPIQTFLNTLDWNRDIQSQLIDLFLT